MPMLRAWLIRHGQSTANAGLATHGAAESPLTRLGREQALRAARQVVAQPDLIVISPFQRAIETAAPVIERWPGAPTQTWPIYEFTYLSAAKCVGLNVDGRRPMADAYWERADPLYQHGDDAESFAHFANRLIAFHQRLREEEGFVVVVGHGQFFHAYQRALARGLAITPEWMRAFRRADLNKPIANGEIVKVDPAGVELLRKG